MKKIKQVSTFIMVLVIIMVSLVACQNGDTVISETKISSYIVNDDKTETLIDYSIQKTTADCKSITEMYSPDGVLWQTLENGEFTKTAAFTEEIEKELNEIISSTAYTLVGKNSDDLDYKSIKSEDGMILDEYFSSKSGQYKTLHHVYEFDSPVEYKSESEIDELFS